MKPTVLLRCHIPTSKRTFRGRCLLSGYIALISALSVFSTSIPAAALSPVLRMASRVAPSETAVPRLEAPDASFLQSAPLYASIDLGSPTNTERARAKSLVSGHPASAIGFGRIVARLGIDGHVMVRAGTDTVRVRVRSAGATQVRVGLSFSDKANYNIEETTRSM